MSEIIEIRFALSVRQPWAWLIVNGYKDIENREWYTAIRRTNYIHTGKTMTQEDYDGCYEFVRDRFPGLEIPRPQDLPLGGIVGSAEIADCVTRSESKWFTGPYGFALKKRRPCEFIPCKGAQGFFRPVVDGRPVVAGDLRFVKEAA